MTETKVYVGLNDAFTFVFDIGRFGFIRVRIIADGKALQVHDDFGHILLHPGNRAEFMKDAVNLYLTDSRTRQRREHDPAQGISQSDPVPSLKRFHDKSSVALIR